MRVWMNSDGHMLTDEQLLRHIAAFGSLSAACEQGDVKLLSKEAETAPKTAGGGQKPRLSDYLKAV